jgi:hypothetical protein
MIPESKNFDTRAIKKFGSLMIVFELLGALIAVDFDRQPEAKTNEVDDVATDSMLPSEFFAELLVAQMRPEFGFGIGLFGSQAFCVVHRTELPPHPNPLPRRRGRGDKDVYDVSNRRSLESSISRIAGVSNQRYFSQINLPLRRG